MFDFIFSAQFLFGLVFGAVAGSFVGIGLSRRSKTANKIYDDARARWDKERAEMLAQIQRLQAKGKD